MTELVAVFLPNCTVFSETFNSWQLDDANTPVLMLIHLPRTTLRQYQVSLAQYCHYSCRSCYMQLDSFDWFHAYMFLPGNFAAVAQQGTGAWFRQTRDSCIFRERVHKCWSPETTNEKMQNAKICKIRSKRAREGSRDVLLEFWDPLHISGTREATNLTRI